MNVLGVVAVAVAHNAPAQVYQVKPDAPASKNQTGNASSQDKSLGWGSNIQNARLARAAESALQHGDHAQALEYAQRAALAAPNDPQLWFLLGYAARLDAKYQQSVDAYSRGLRLSPSSPDGLSGLAQSYAMMGRSDEAERLLNQAFTANPRRRDDALLLGNLYMKSRNYEEAIDWANKAERLQPDMRSELLLALSYEQQKQMDMASHYLELAKRHSPDNADVQRSFAGYYREVGKYSEAIAALKSIHNPNPDVTAELAYTYQLDGKLNDSAKLYASAANTMPKDLSLQLSAAQAEIAVGSLSEANSFVNRAAGLDANHYRLHAIRGKIAQLEEHNQDAVQEYKAALANLPAAPVEGPLYGIQLHMDLMTLYKYLRDESAAHHELETAQSEVSAVNESGSGKESLLRLKALIDMNAGHLDLALNHINEALAISPHDRDDLQLDGDILMKMGRNDDAIAAYKQVLTIDPVNRFALISLGYASRAAGRNQDAEKYFQRLQQADPSLYMSYLALGDLYTARRELTKAQDSYSKAYQLASLNPLIVAGGLNAAVEAHDLSLGATWFGRETGNMDREPQVLRENERYLSFAGKYQESAEVGQKAIQVLPQDRDVVVYLGYDLLHLEKYDDLLKLTSAYMTVLPKEPDIPLLAGYVHKHQGLSEQARQDFTETLNRDPNVVTAYVNRGYMLNDLHQPQAAATDFEAAIKREPNDGEAHLGLAYADLDLHKSEAALQESKLAERTMGDSKDLHLIRATAYGREEMLAKATAEYKAALKFDPNDAAAHFGLGNTLFAERHYRDAIGELEIAATFSPNSVEVDALLARSYANLQDRAQTMRYVELAESHVGTVPASQQSQVYLSTGEALSVLGDKRAALDRFTKALTTPNGDRMSVRLALAQLMAEQGHTEDAERQIALGLMEAEGGETAAPDGSQFIAAADVFRSAHDYQLSQTYLERAKSAGAPDGEVRLGLANNYLAVGDTFRAKAELAAMSSVEDSAPSYQYLLAQANVFRQEHQNAQALTSFAQASNAEGDDQTVEQSMLQAGANEGLRITPSVSLLSDFSIQPIFEDSTVYVLDSKLDASFAVPGSDTALLPPPRSSIQTEWTDAYHLHFGDLPTFGGFFQLRNARGLISVPSTNSIVNRDTTDYTVNFGLSPTVHFGTNAITLDSGVQETIRRDSVSPVQLDQNLFRAFTYLTTSSFFDVISVSGYGIWESGPFTESNLHSRALTGAIDFRVGAPWGKTALVTGYGINDQLFNPVNYEDHYISAYVGLERKFTERLNVRAVAEDLRAWRVVGNKSGIAQDLRPAGTVEFSPKRNWELQISTAYSNTRGFHVYDAIQNSFAISYAMPFHRKFNDDSGALNLQYPIRFSAGLQEESFFNFSGAQNQQLRPYVQVTIF